MSAQHSSGAAFHSRPRIIRDIATTLLLTFALLALKAVFETTTPGKLLDGALYAWLQTRLAEKDTKLPVVVVDISQLDAESVPGRLTPREQLTRLVDLIVREQPDAIGIDVDFAPEEKRPGEKRWTDRGGPQFFDRLDRAMTPIYLGVHRSRYGKPEQWLGAEDYAKFAANIAVSSENTARMPLWIRKGDSGTCVKEVSKLVDAQHGDEGPRDKAREAENTTCLPAMAVALAREYHNRHKHGTRWPAWFAKPFEEVTLDEGKQLHTADFFVDYSEVPDLQAQTATAVVSDREVQLTHASNQYAFDGKIVLLGNTASWEKTPDKYPIPPWQKEVPGAYLHASAVYTLIQGPLLEITGWGRLFLDVFFASLVMVCVDLLRLWYHCKAQSEVAEHRVHFLFSVLAVFIVITMGLLLVRQTRILWTDWFLVSVALLFHSWIERYVDDSLKWLRAAWQRFVFESGERAAP